MFQESEHKKYYENISNENAIHKVIVNYWIALKFIKNTEEYSRCFECFKD